MSAPFSIEESQSGWKWATLIGAVALPLVTGTASSLAVARSVATWYVKLDKPSWTPPAWLFGPVWTTLYTLMGIASWLVWRKGRESCGSDWESQASKREANGALKLYGVHLVFNALWTLIFFGLRRIGLALGEIVILWSLVVATAARFYRVRPVAGLLFVPYILWASLATALNAEIWRKNR